MLGDGWSELRRALQKKLASPQDARGYGTKSLGESTSKHLADNKTSRVFCRLRTAVKAIAPAVREAVQHLPSHQDALEEYLPRCTFDMISAVILVSPEASERPLDSPLFRVCQGRHLGVVRDDIDPADIQYITAARVGLDKAEELLFSFPPVWKVRHCSIEHASAMQC